MPPANIFDILVRSALTAHVRRGSDNAFSTRLYGFFLRRSIPFFKPEQPFYTYFIDLLILQEGLRYLFFELTTRRTWPKCAYWEHLLARSGPAGWGG